MVMKAWEALARGEDNPLAQLLAQDRRLTALIDPAEIRVAGAPPTTFSLPVMVRKPFSSLLARSPVWYQPSRKAAAVSSGLL